MAIALALNLVNDQTREIYLYDTFSGMTELGDKDICSLTGVSVQEKYQASKIFNDLSYWSYAPIEELKRNVYSTGYPTHLFKFVQERVEDTIPGIVPENIALLRLDTDLYESTKHESEHLYPLLAKDGVLIIDDYEHYEGAKIAVDEYIYKRFVYISKQGGIFLPFIYQNRRVIAFSPTLVSLPISDTGAYS